MPVAKGRTSWRPNASTVTFHLQVHTHLPAQSRLSTYSHTCPPGQSHLLTYSHTRQPASSHLSTCTSHLTPVYRSVLLIRTEAPQ